MKSPGLKEKRKERKEVFLVSHQTWDNWDELWNDVIQAESDADKSYSDVMVTVDEGGEPHSSDLQRLKHSLDCLELVIRVFRSETAI